MKLIRPHLPSRHLQTSLLLSACVVFGACVEESELELAALDLEFELDQEADTALDHAGEIAAPSEEASNLSAQCGPVGYWYQNPAPVPWFDLANCYVAPLPGGVQPFVYANNWYVQPGPGNSCAIGWFDLANCYIGSAPAGSQAFILNGHMYFTPIPVEAIPSSRGGCFSPWGPGPIQNCALEAQTEALDYATDPNGTSNYTWMWGNPCPPGTSIIDGSQFYVPNSCVLTNTPVCGPERRYARYNIGVMCE